MSTECGSVLVVEPDVDSRTVIATLFVRRGYRVRQAAGGEEALDLARQERPILVLLDVHLPDMSGYEVCHQLRAEFGVRLPIVFVSGERTESYDRVVGLRLGADDYITKPFAHDELMARVDRLIAHAAPDSAGAPVTVTSRLSRRELQVLQLLADGRTPKEIAHQLDARPKTISNHIQNILVKLGVHSQAQAVSVALKNGAPEIRRASDTHTS